MICKSANKSGYFAWKQKTRLANRRQTHTTYSSSYPSSSGSPVLGSQSFTTNFSVFENVQVTERTNKEAAATLRRIARAHARTHARTQAAQARNINSPKLMTYTVLMLVLRIWFYITTLSSRSLPIFSLPLCLTMYGNCVEK